MEHLVDSFVELKRLRDLQYESDFNDQTELAKSYQSQANDVQKLINQGVEFIPLF